MRKIKRKLKNIKRIIKRFHVEKIDNDLYFAFIGSYTTNGATKKEFLKNIIDIIKLNYNL